MASKKKATKKKLKKGKKMELKKTLRESGVTIEAKI
jgi:hypothetical protein